LRLCWFCRYRRGFQQLVPLPAAAHVFQQFVEGAFHQIAAAVAVDELARGVAVAGFQRFQAKPVGRVGVQRAFVGLGGQRVQRVGIALAVSVAGVE